MPKRSMIWSDPIWSKAEEWNESEREGRTREEEDGGWRGVERGFRVIVPKNEIDSWAVESEMTLVDEIGYCVASKCMDTALI